MHDEEWKLKVSRDLGEIKNESENNRSSHDHIRDSLQEIKDNLKGLPCEERSKDIEKLKSKLSKPYMIGVIVIALIPVLILFWKVQDIKAGFTKESEALHKTQEVLKQFMLKNGYLIEQEDSSKTIEKKDRSK